MKKYMNVEIEGFCECDYESIVRNFWMHSVTNRMNEFDFCAAFKSMREPIRSKLSEHGLLTFEEFCENEENFFDYSCLEQFTVNTNYICIDIEAIKKGVLKAKYDAFRDTFESYSTFNDLKGLLCELDNYHGATIEEKIILFDKIIHSQHETGDIFDELNIDDLREEVENEIHELINL